MRYFKPGFQVHELIPRRNAWTFSLFAIGREADDDDHNEDLLITWYLQFIFWQFSYSWEKDHE